MMDSAGVALFRKDPRLNGLKYKEIVCSDEFHVYDAAFEIGKAFCNQRRGYLLAVTLLSANLRNLSIRALSSCQSQQPSRQSPRRNGNYAFPGDFNALKL